MLESCIPTSECVSRVLSVTACPDKMRRYGRSASPDRLESLELGLGAATWCGCSSWAVGWSRLYSSRCQPYKLAKCEVFEALRAQHLEGWSCLSCSGLLPHATPLVFSSHAIEQRIPMSKTCSLRFMIGWCVCSLFDASTTGAKLEVRFTALSLVVANITAKQRTTGWASWPCCAYRQLDHCLSCSSLQMAKSLGH